MESGNQPPDKSPSESDSNLPKPRAHGVKGASRITGMSMSWLAKARMGITSSPGPKFKKVGRKIIYTDDALETWLHR